MQKKSQTLHLLLLDPSQNDAEKIVSLLRNAGHATRAHRVTSEEDLEESLGAQNWDLFIAKPIADELEYATCLKTVRSKEKDIPFILMTEDNSEEYVLSALQAGARDVVPIDQLERLVAVAKREFQGLQDRRRRGRLEAHLREAEKRCQLLLDSSRDAIAYVAEGMHIYANHSYLELFGIEDLDDMICIPVIDVIASKDQDAFKGVLKEFRDNPAETTLPCTIRKEDESEEDVVLTFSEATYDGEDCIQLIARPQVDSELEEKLKRFSSEDLLTGLYNRPYFTDNLSEKRELAVNGKFQGALIYIELDHFEGVRDQHSISGADTLLAQLASVLREIADESDTIARLADDTFAMLTSAFMEDALKEKGEGLRAAIADHVFTIGQKSVQITASVGIVRINDTVPDVKELFERAHKAASHVSELPNMENGNGVYVYSALDFDNSKRHEDMVAMLQQALDENRFRLLFQPIISLRGESQEHYETFLRMINNQGKEISPNDFLPVEDTPELATKLDRWVIIQNVKSLSAHRSKGHDTRLLITITHHTLVDSTFTEWLGMALKAANLPGSSLILQISEDAAIQHLNQAKAFSEGLATLGCAISLSRFGCALNPFNTLKHVDARYIKLDGSFTEDVQSSEEAREKLTEMVGQLHENKRKCIMPLVESAAILSTLWQAGIDYIQGYYLQAPSTQMDYDFSDSE